MQKLSDQTLCYFEMQKLSDQTLVRLFFFPLHEAVEDVLKSMRTLKNNPWTATSEKKVEQVHDDFYDELYTLLTHAEEWVTDSFQFLWPSSEDEWKSSEIPKQVEEFKSAVTKSGKLHFIEAFLKLDSTKGRTAACLLHMLASSGDDDSVELYGMEFTEFEITSESNYNAPFNEFHWKLKAALLAFKDNFMVMMKPKEGEAQDAAPRVNGKVLVLVPQFEVCLVSLSWVKRTCKDYDQGKLDKMDLVQKVGILETTLTAIETLADQIERLIKSCQSVLPEETCVIMTSLGG